MAITSTANNNPEAGLLYAKTTEFLKAVLQIQDTAREMKYQDSIDIDKSYPEILKAISKVEKLTKYTLEVRELIKQYEVVSIAPRFNDRPARSPKSRKDPARKSFSFDDLMDSD